jgi:hypothetical protein
LRLASIASMSSKSAGVGISDFSKWLIAFCSGYPRPMNGMLVAMIVMNWTFASSGRLAI